MSATDELRRLLDECGVEYKRHYLNTLWYAGTKLYMATDDTDGTLTVDNITPEQAIAATLGGVELDSRAERTCEKVYATGGIIARVECRNVCSDVEQFTCSACGFNCNLTSWITPIGYDRPIVHHHHGTPNYCPNCGAKVQAND